MTPSRWHDDAKDRDAGHDEMQAAVWRHRRSQACRDNVTLGYSEFAYDGTAFECPFVHEGKIVAWGDVVERWTEVRTQGRPKRGYIIFEIKPRIYSVGAVVRQCVALGRAVSSARPTREDYWTPEVRVWPVIPADDPKLPLLQEVYRAAVWNGKELEQTVFT